MEEVKKRNPDVIFFLENVRMDKASETIITRAMGIQPIFINSALVCAQNRERNYWTNIGAVRSGLFGDVVCGIQQPKDMGVFLRDILQPMGEVNKKYYLSQTAMKRFVRRRENGFSALKVMPEKTGALATRSNSGQLQMDSGVKPNQVKAACLTGGGHSAGNHSDMDIIMQHGFVNDSDFSEIVDKSTCIDANYSKGIDNKHARTGIIQHGRGYNEGGEFFDKCPPITANSWQHNHTLKQARQINGSKESGGKQPYQQNSLYDMNGISPAQSAGLSTGSPLFTDGMVFRRLTVIECCRLQGIRDDFFFDKNGKQVVSDSQAYKMLGNGWQCDTIKYIFQHAI